jgi:hypothetical protein
MDRLSNLTARDIACWRHDIHIVSSCIEEALNWPTPLSVIVSERVQCVIAVVEVSLKTLQSPPGVVLSLVLVR